MMTVRIRHLAWVVLGGFLILNIAAQPVSEIAAITLTPLFPSCPIPLEDDEAIYKVKLPETCPPTFLLPDLHTLPPTHLLLQILRGQGVTRLRFTNTIWNSGPGNLEMQAVPFPLPGAVHVSQVIFRTDGTSFLREAGLFDFHNAHGHWHWDGFSIYQVWSLTPRGKLDQIMASSDKVGYCLIDMAPYTGADAPPFPEGIAPSERAQYGGCIWTRQGISAGWIDSYKSHIGGQFVDITHLRDGVYALRSIVDPDNIIREGDETNNHALIYFKLTGEKLEVIGERYIQPNPEHIPD